MTRATHAHPDPLDRPASPAPTAWTVSPVPAAPLASQESCHPTTCPSWEQAADSAHQDLPARTDNRDLQDSPETPAATVGPETQDRQDPLATPDHAAHPDSPARPATQAVQEPQDRTALAAAKDPQEDQDREDSPASPDPADLQDQPEVVDSQDPRDHKAHQEHLATTALPASQANPDPAAHQATTPATAPAHHAAARLPPRHLPTFHRHQQHHLTSIALFSPPLEDDLSLKDSRNFIKHTLLTLLLFLQNLSTLPT